jgi:uncharacterized protein involved in oxidation of intracellular sulfur
VVANDPPYGSERLYNALRLAVSLAKREGEQVRLFLLGDAAAAARSGQQVPQGFYNIERLLAALSQRGGEIGVCGTCMDARAMRQEELPAGAHRGTMDQLTDWTVWADKVLVF